MERVGHYRIVSELGRGGAGVVYRAAGPQGQPVALKVLLSGDESSDYTRRRFARECEALTRLQHPNLVRVREAGEHQGRPFLAMDLVEGDDLETLIRRNGRFAAEATVALGRALAQGLAHAHALGILHRDVKPANVILEASGRPRLGDFGLAKDLEASVSRLSVTGAFLGTPAYWPPEQAHGAKDLTPAADVFALGGTLFHLLSGQPPHALKTLNEVMRHGYQPPRPLREVAPDVDPGLAAIVDRCLADEPQARFPSMQALDAALATWRSPGPARARGASMLWTLPLGALGLVLVIAAASFRADPSAASLPTPPPSPVSTPEEPPPPQAERGPAAHLQQIRAEVQALARESKFAEALARLDRYVEEYSQAPEPYLLRGKLRIQLQREGGDGDLVRATELAPDKAWVWHSRAMSEVSRPETLATGAESAARAVGLDPTYAEAYVPLGKALLDLERPVEARAALDRALELDETLTWAWINRAALSFRQKRFAQANADVQRALELEPTNVTALENLAMGCDELRQNEATIDACERALAVEDTGRMHDLRGQALARLGRREEALEAFTTALSPASSARPANALEVLLRRSSLLGALGRTKDSLADADAAIARHPESARAHFLRGVALAKLNRTEDAERATRRSLELAPDNADALYNLALLKQRLRKPQAEAIQLLERALLLKPEHWDARLDLSVVHYSALDAVAARRHLERYFAEAPAEHPRRAQARRLELEIAKLEERR